MEVFHIGNQMEVDHVRHHPPYTLLPRPPSSRPLAWDARLELKGPAHTQWLALHNHLFEHDDDEL